MDNKNYYHHQTMGGSDSWALVSTQSDFLKLQPGWERLFRCNIRHSPFQAWGWVNAWLNHLAGPHELLIVCHRGLNGELDFILPLIRRTAGSIGRPAVMLACSYGPEASEKLGSLRTPDLDDQAATMVAEAISRFIVPSDSASLGPLDSNRQTPDSIASAISVTGRRTSIRPGVECPTLDLPETWDVYLKQLSSNFRAQVRRSAKNFTGTGEFRGRELTPADADTFTHELIRLSCQRMQTKGRSSSLEGKSFQAFLTEAVPYMASQGLAWMDVVENDTGIFGVALNFIYGKDIYYYNGGFDDQINKLRPGTALFASAIRRGIESGYTSFNFLRGSEPYKYRWGAKNIADQRIIVFPAARAAALPAAIADCIDVTAARARQTLSRARERLKDNKAKNQG